MPRRAEVRLAAHLEPDLHLRLEIQIAQRAVARRFRPLADCFELVVFRGGEKIRSLLPGTTQPQRAKVILSTLEKHRRQLLTENFPDDRDILANELLLQIDRMRGNDPFPTGLNGKPRGGQKIRERLPHPGSRFRDERRGVDQRLRHGHRELLLLRAVFEIAGFRQNPFRRKCRPHRIAESGHRLTFRN